MQFRRFLHSSPSLYDISQLSPEPHNAHLFGKKHHNGHEVVPAVCISPSLCCVFRPYAFNRSLIFQVVRVNQKFLHTHWQLLVYRLDLVWCLDSSRQATTYRQQIVNGYSDSEEEVGGIIHTHHVFFHLPTRIKMKEPSNIRAWASVSRFP